MKRLSHIIVVIIFIWLFAGYATADQVDHKIGPLLHQKVDSLQQKDIKRPAGTQDQFSEGLLKL